VSSMVRFWAVRIQCLILAKACSIGFADVIQSVNLSKQKIPGAPETLLGRCRGWLRCCQAMAQPGALSRQSAMLRSTPKSVRERGRAIFPSKLV